MKNVALRPRQDRKKWVLIALLLLLLGGFAVWFGVSSGAIRVIEGLSYGDEPNRS